MTLVNQFKPVASGCACVSERCTRCMHVHVFTRVTHTRRQSRELSGWLRLVLVYFIVRLALSSAVPFSPSPPPHSLSLSLNPTIAKFLVPLSFSRVGGSKKWRTIKRNDTVKKQDVRWLRKRPTECTHTLVSNRIQTRTDAFGVRSCTYKWYRWTYVG